MTVSDWMEREKIQRIYVNVCMQVIKIIFYDSERERDREKWETIETQTVNRRRVCACALRDEKNFSLISLGLKKFRK